MSQLPYRPDIDGLRALAVLAVLIYHAGFSFLPGGFMGVDIFFVISGFLITSFIVRDIKDGTFSMVGFWERRARRILPPLFVVVVATLAAGAFIFLPFDFAQLGKEMASQAVFGSNILFMFQGGYFADGDGFKALLHTWSLAVEEQFYLFYPIGMALFARFVSRNFFYIILPAAILSLVLCLCVSHYSDRVAFYALPFRGWELLAGALVAIAPAMRPSLRNIAAFVGVGCILWSLFFYHPPMPFPGWPTLFPVIGASLLIWSGGGTLAGKILSLKPMVAIGLISYSLYLWHWPLLVYARYLPIYEVTPLIGYVCMALAFVLSYLTWKFVEQPVRKKQILHTRESIFLVSLAGLAVMAAIGGAIIATKGFPQRFDDSVLSYANGKFDGNPHRDECDQPEIADIEQGKACQTNPGAGIPTFVVWGDSMADAIAPAFYGLSEKTGKNGYILTGHGCPPILGAKSPRSFKGFDCTKFNDAVYDLMVRENIKTIFIVGSWGNWLRPGQITFAGDTSWYRAEDDRFNNITMAALQRTIEQLQKLGVSVRIVKNPPPTPLPIDPPRQLALENHYGIINSRAFTSTDYYDANRKDGIMTFRELSGDEGVAYIDPKPYLCNADRCAMGRDGKSLYFNPGHLSAYAARELEPMIRPFFD